MEQLQGILTAFVEMIQKFVGENESLKGLFDKVMEILKNFLPKEEEAAE